MSAVLLFAVNVYATWSDTANLVADQLRRHLPSPDLLTAEQRLGAPDGYRSRLSDFINASERYFVSLIDAVVELIDHEGPGTNHDFIMVARSQVVLAIPLGEPGERPPPA